MAHHRFNLCNLGEQLDDVLEAVGWGLGELGHSATIRKGLVTVEEINVLVGAFSIRYQETTRQAPRVINYNLEQIGGEPRPGVGARHFALMRNVPNWDYSRRNIEVLGTAGITDVTHVPLGYAPVLERIVHGEKDIDVVFYGSVNPRRVEIIRAMERMGLNVAWTSKGAWTREERDGYIARAKVVLNMGFFEQVHILEEVRLAYLLCNRVAVVSEIRPDTYAEDDLIQCVAGAALADLPDLCASMCASTGRRLDLAERGYETFRKREWLGALGRAVDDFAERNPERSRTTKRDVDPPARINIGSGRNWRFDFFNIDLEPSRGADLVFDLSRPFPHDEWFQTWRFGRASLPRGCADYILAEHVLEHVRDIVQCMTTCLDWLKVGGMLEIEVPYDLSYGAWQDPTHVRAFNERSWYYYTGWCWYVGWREHCFDLVSQVHLLSDLGQSLTASGVDADTIVRTPRAVDALRVKLVKRALTDAEKADHEQYFREV